MKIKKGDNVIVITGKDKGKSGKVVDIFTKKELVLLDGVNVIKKHQKPRKSGQKGQIVERAMPIHISNVALLEGSKKVRAGYIKKGEKKVRVSKKTGKEI